MQCVCTCGLIHEAVYYGKALEKNIRRFDGMLNFLFLFSCVSPQGMCYFLLLLLLSDPGSLKTSATN